MYGIIKGDINMIIPNALGLFFAIFQVIVYTVFYCKKKNEDNFDIGDDDKLV